MSNEMLALQSNNGTELSVYKPEILSDDEPEILSDDEFETGPTESKQYKIMSIDVQEELSEDELKILAESIVDLGMKIKYKNDSLDAVKSEASSLKKSIDALQSDLIIYATDYDYGKKNRTYSCYRKDNFELGIAEYIDINTGRVIKTEPFVDGDIFNPIDSEEFPDAH